MFSALKAVWHEAKADVALEARADDASREAGEVLRSYYRMDAQRQHRMTKAFHIAKAHLEKAIGSSSNWNAADKANAAKSLMENARKGVEADPRSAMGIALLSLFYEAQTLPGKQAAKLVADIERWYLESAHTE